MSTMSTAFTCSHCGAAGVELILPKEGRELLCEPCLEEERP